MAKFISGLVIGALVTLLVLTLFGGLFYARAKGQLIDQWRQVKPGMERETVVKLIGEPTYDMKLGEGFPSWAEVSVPDDYYQTHGLLVFLVRGPGPQLLLVFLDADDRVSFVSSTYT